MEISDIQGLRDLYRRRDALRDLEWFLKLYAGFRRDPKLKPVIEGIEEAARRLRAKSVKPTWTASIRSKRPRTDFADLEVIQKQLARVPTRRELARTALGIIFATTMMLTTLSLLFFLR
jgi:hypothetical protein